MKTSSPRRELSVRFRALCFAVFVCAWFVPTVFAQDNWLGGAGNWSVSTNWSAGVPTPTSDVFIDHGHAGASVVTEDISLGVGGAVCHNLTIDSDDSLVMPEGSEVTVNGPTVSNAGSISLESAGFGVRFNIADNVKLSGGGTITMSNSATNEIYGTVVGLTLTNSVHTI